VSVQNEFSIYKSVNEQIMLLSGCRKLSLSTNMIDKISGLSSMRNLTILSLARNNIKSLSGLETLANNLEQLWLSYNVIDKLKGLEMLKKLKVLYIGNNLIRDWGEVAKLYQLKSLEDLLLVGNPVAEAVEEAVFRKEVIKRVPFIKKLDGVLVVHVGENE
jgi:dynein light chain 1, axonemal